MARHADARVYCVAGSRARDEARLLRLSEGIRFTSSPRGANILLITGELDECLIVPTLVAHDALVAPRATIAWRPGRSTSLIEKSIAGATVVNQPDPIPTLRQVHEELVTGRRDGEEAMLPPVEPAPWWGIGPYGQGGKAMTGGVPYGRPLPERGDDRDGLKLDRLSVRVGPLFAPFPTGLALDLVLQGDVVQDVVVENFADPGPRPVSIFERGLREPVPLSELELARTRSHLFWLSDAVSVGGPASLSQRILRMAQRIRPSDADEVRSLEVFLRRCGFLGSNARGIGIVAAADLGDVGGPVARASGAPVDSRSDQEDYRRIGFEPLTHEGGDVAARWRQRLREAAQSLELAQRAGGATTGGNGSIEAPRGTLTVGRAPSAALAGRVPALIAGMEWGDAVSTVTSLDLDMSEAHSEYASAEA